MQSILQERQPGKIAGAISKVEYYILTIHRYKLKQQIMSCLKLIKENSQQRKDDAINLVGRKGEKEERNVRNSDHVNK